MRLRRGANVPGGTVLGRLGRRTPMLRFGIRPAGEDAPLLEVAGDALEQLWAFIVFPLIGDYALNIANELTAAIFAEANLVRMVPSYDLNWRQLAAMLARTDASRFEAVIHQHIPMFHMEHCVFAHTLSTGKDFRDCGRPCERHQVDLKDRVGQPHPLVGVQPNRQPAACHVDAARRVSPTEDEAFKWRKTGTRGDVRH